MFKLEIERRRYKRFSRETLVTVRTQAGEGEQKCATRDISTGGVFFYCDTQIQQGSSIEVVMVLPSEITGGQTLWACCRAKVLRAAKDMTGRQYGIAAQVERLEFMPDMTA